MKKLFAWLLFLSLVMVGCSLKHSNPLDPEGHDITIPPTITGLTLNASAAGQQNKWVEVRWTRIKTSNTVKKYYIYQGLAYNSKYTKVQEVINPPASDTTSTLMWRDSNVIAREYFYKISSVNEQGLEGTLSPWRWVSVPQ